jgi:pyruvate/2-oxoacid:ferredoxin oxidoreductase alpha subunit
MVGVAGSFRELIVGTATSSVGLDHMAETVRSLGASGLGNVVLVNVCRATANFPLCIEGDPSDHFAHRDSGFIQYMSRGKQQIYDSILQLPAVGMHPAVLTPTMPAFYGIKDSHRSAKLVVEPDAAVNAFLDDALAWGRNAPNPAYADFIDSGQEVPQTPPGLLDGDTAMGSCVTSAFFQGFKVSQKRRLQTALSIIPEIAKRFERAFGRPGLQLFEQHGFEERPDAVLIAIGPDAGTALQLLPRWREQLHAKVGVIVLRLITPFPSQALAAALRGVKAVGVVNQAFHHGRGHLTLDLESALHGDGQRTPVEAFFCGLGGAGVSAETWTEMARLTVACARAGAPAKQWHQLHEARELDEAAQEDAA